LREDAHGTDAAEQASMRAYSTDLRERSVRVVADGQPLRAAARRVGVRVSAVKRYVVRQQETGSLERRPIPGGPRKISREQDAILLGRLEAAPDATVLEHGAWWAEHQGQAGAVAGAVAGAAPPRLDAEHKSLAASERDEAERAAWREAAAQLDPEQLVFVDESGPHTALTRLYGWAPQAQRATGSTSRHHGKQTTLVAALTAEGLQAPWTIAGARDTDAFERSVTEEWGPPLRPGQLVVLDNRSVHQAERIREAIAARPCAVLFLPPSSPDCPRSSRRSPRSRRSCARRVPVHGTRA
jgi:transposase